MDNKAALRKYIASFNTSDRAELGKSPPCRSYRSLIPFEEFNLIETRLTDVQSKEEIQSLKDEFKPFKQAIQDLLSMGKAAATRLVYCITQEVKRLEANQKQESAAASARISNDK